MDKQALEEKLLELFDGIKKFLELEMEVIKMPADKIGNRKEDLLKSLMILQETFDSLRLIVKYLLFDLEMSEEEKH